MTIISIINQWKMNISINEEEKINRVVKKAAKKSEENLSMKA